MSAPTLFDGLRVAAFEARMAGPMADLIAKHGGTPVEAPALREIPLEDHHEALGFAGKLIAGEFDVVLFETGVGFRYLTGVIEARYPREIWLDALGRTKVVARGPKPLAALRELKVRADVQVPEPNTWHETLAALDQHLPISGLRIAVQEYGKTNAELLDGLTSRGAIVTRVPVYRWALPENLEPLRSAIREIADRKIGAVLFTAAQQVIHVLQIATEVNLAEQLRDALETHIVVGSIGPTTTETLRDAALPVDIEPEHPKMGHLVAAVAEGWRRVGKSAN